MTEPSALTQIKEGTRYRRRDGSISPPLIKGRTGGDIGMACLLDPETNFAFPLCKAPDAGMVIGVHQHEKDLMEEVF